MCLNDKFVPAPAASTAAATTPAPPMEAGWAAIQKMVDLAHDGFVQGKTPAGRAARQEPGAQAAPAGPEAAQSPDILLVEDNAGDVRMIREAFREAGVAHRLTAVKDGVEALAYLHRQGPYASAPRPDLVLLDLNLPRKDGREVLAQMKRDERTRRIPVVVLTSSSAPGDVRASYDLHANCYVRKPLGLDQFVSAVKSIEQFWLQPAVVLPGEG